MNKLVIVMAALAVVAMSLWAYVGYSTLLVNVGFTADDLVAPTPEIVTRSIGHAPTPSTNVPQNAEWSAAWEIPGDGIYSGFGSVLWLTLRNLDSKDIWVYGMAFTWTGTDLTYSKDAGTLAEAGQDALVGLLPFDAPLDPGSHQYEISLKVAVQGYDGRWYDWGERSLTGSNYLQVLSTYPSAIWSTETNPTYYYNELNQRLEEGAVSEVVSLVQDTYPQGYNLLQVCQVYEWVRTNIEYVSDEGDYWQGAGETMNLLTGDCEDQAILMCTMVKALGGNARLNIISGHAFPTVFVSEDEAGLADIESSIASYYWAEPGSLLINYLNDELGYWLVIDTAGVPYVGGLPALSRYASTDSAAGYWSFSSSSFLITVDATGRTSSAPNLF